jgi:DNA invertase Pin-like site-specific DNA recombinase
MRMMLGESHQKVTTAHLSRDAYLYVRQSTIRQVFENTESTTRQYALSARAVALGWPVERVHVIDTDLGQSGATADREGFQRLVTEVGLGRAGIVLGLEVSRLARNSTDWHRLLELCALSDTLILDEDGVYDPAHFNDRLLLGLKGTMSEAELHVLRARLRGGILSKARRGELRGPIPIGFVYGPDETVILDPDAQVQDVIRFFFETYRRTGSMLATVKEFRTRDLAFPRRVRRGPHTGELVWGEMMHSRARQMIHNPRYAGAFFFGRTRTRTGPDGQKRVSRLPRDQWILLPGIHPGYITWDEYEDNLRRLQANAQARGSDRRRSPPREGPALLQGLAICGMCGERMTVRYHSYHGKSVPDYWCGRSRINAGQPGVCQTIHGGSLDDSIGEILIEAVTPLALEVALTVQQELVARAEQADRIRQQHVERARYDADLAQRRFLRVDPENRLVADALEAAWNDRLRALATAQESYERERANDARVVSDEQRAEILALATDFPRLWRDPATSAREKKRMMRLLITDVTLTKGHTLHADIRFTGGTTRSLDIPLPKSCIELRTTDAAIVREIDQLLDTYTDTEVADVLNKRGVRTATMRAFTRSSVIHLRVRHGLKHRRTRLLEAGLLTPSDLAARYGVRLTTIHMWRRRGLLRAHSVTGKGEYLYEIPSENMPAKHAPKGAYQAKPATPTSGNQRGAV